MIMIDGYSIEQYPKQNTVVILLPQTLGTCTSTVGKITERREVLNDNELASILNLTKAYYQVEKDKDM